jgi:hypothetical protein
MAERRQTKRVATQFRVWCEGDDFTFLTQALNVSRGGLFVRSSQPPPAGRRFAISIEELGAVAEVEVRWVRGGGGSRSGAGLQIVTFSQGEREWERFVDQNTSRSGEHVIGWTPGDEE